MSSNVNIQMTANDREVLKVLQAQTRALDKLENRMDKVSRTSRRAATTTKKGMNDATGATMKFVGAVAGIGGVIGAVQMAAAALRSEYDNLTKRQEAARLSQMDAAGAFRRLRVNFADDDTMKGGDLEGLVAGIVERQGSTTQIVAAALSDAFSAKGQLSNKVVIDTVEQAVRILPDDMESTTELSSRALDVLKVNPELSPKAVLGFLRETQQSSRVTSLDKLGKSAVPAIVAMSKTGDTAEQAAELFATFTQSTADSEGLKSARGLKNFANLLQEFQVSKIDTKGKDDTGTFSIPQEQIDAFKTGRNTQQRIEMMRNSPELRRQFLGQTSFDSFVRSTNVGLLSGDADTDAIFQAAKRNIKAPSRESAAKFDQFIPELDAGEFEAVARAARDSAASLEISKQQDKKGGRAGIAKKILESTFSGDGGRDLPGFDFTGRANRMANFQASVALGQAPEKAAIEEFKQAEALVRAPFANLPFLDPKTDSELSDYDRETIEEIRKQTRALEKLYQASQQKPQRPQPQGRAPAAGLGRDRR